MNKIPTIFIRDLSKQPSLVTPEWHPDCLWVRDGEGVAKRKYDGTCVLVRAGKMYKRRELRQGDVAPPEFEPLEFDPNTGKTVGWIPVGDGPDDRWHREAIANENVLPYEGTYELLGPKINKNKDGRDVHTLQAHRFARTYSTAPRTFEELKTFLSENVIEGLVWHHIDGRMAKIKRRDFGLRW